MADNLPLIPDKCAAVCSDVRGVLRQVFREVEEVEEVEEVPPVCGNVTTHTRLADVDHNQHWLQEYNTERQKLWDCEGELKQKRAKRLARTPLPNIYRLHPRGASNSFSCVEERGLLDREALMPSVAQDAARDHALWIHNILNTSSTQFSSVQVQGTAIKMPIKLDSYNNLTQQSVSIGEWAPRPAPAPRAPPPAPALPDLVVCVPPAMEFVNFTIGQVHTQRLRVVNLSKLEVRLSVRPPARPELDIEICGPRGLSVSSGSAAELKVHFRARNVRILHDVLQIRVSTGQEMRLPIVCYMEPPLLHILVPSTPLASWPARPPAATRRADVIELGAQLLGDVHSAALLLRCDAKHASFFILTEDDWTSYTLESLTRRGSVLAGPFVVSLSWFRGGGAVVARAWCRAPAPGAHTAALRVLCSTAVVRPLHLIADALYFREYHLTIEGQEKDYDILSEDDPACGYYVHLGAAFPHRALALTVPLHNHSPVSYSFYTLVRRWGMCSCWEEMREDVLSTEQSLSEHDLCHGAREAQQRELMGVCEVADPYKLVRVETPGAVAARSSCPLHIHLPDVGEQLGTQRATVMLILTNIPRESLPPGYDAMVVRSEVINADPIPGVPSWSREVCSVVCAQLEVWWEVVPVRLVLTPPALHVVHSRRVTSIDVKLSATQVYGVEGVLARWEAPALLAPVRLSTTAPVHVTLALPLPALPNEYPDTDIIRVKAPEDESVSTCVVHRRCSTRHVCVVPPRVTLGVVPPARALHAALDVINDTHQRVCWWASPHRWVRERVASVACEGRAPCERCYERACSCGLVRPARGALAHGHHTTLHYNVNAPDSDGCVATVVQVRRSGADVAHAPGGAGVEGRAALIAYRVLAPRLVLRAVPCDGGDACCTSGGCRLDPGALGSGVGTASLRPAAALTAGRCTCYRLLLTNTTPIATHLCWDKPLEEDPLKVKFSPNEIDIEGYAEVQILVVLEARRVCGRRLYVYRAQVLHAYKPLYLLIDAEIAGLEVTCEIPIGDQEVTTSTLILKKYQREEMPGLTPLPDTIEEMFAHEDQRRAVRQQNVCLCKCEMVYIAPVKRPRDPALGTEIEYVFSPPALTRVCSCFTATPPALTQHNEPYCLQYRDLPLRTVMTRTVVVRNAGAVTARWRAANRKWPSVHTHTIHTDVWSGGAGGAPAAGPAMQCAPTAGVAVQCTPAAGVLPAGGTARVHVHVYAHTWGIYRDQILIKMDGVDALVVDVWVQAVGTPLHFPLSPAAGEGGAPPVLWFSEWDAVHAVRARNVSRASLALHAYLLIEHEHPQQVLPFRLYWRYIDVQPRTCPCLHARTPPADDTVCDEGSSSASSVYQEMDTGFEVYLAPDCGTQRHTCYTVSPEVCSVGAGEWAEWRLELTPTTDHHTTDNHLLLLRTLPEDTAGEWWCRVEPAASRVLLRQAARRAHLRASTDTVHVALCALHLPYGDVFKVRKRFHVQNVGNGAVVVCAHTEPPWAVVSGGAVQACGAGCLCVQAGEERRPHHELELHLPPRAAREVCVEVSVDARAVWPPADGTPYDTRTVTRTDLQLCDDINVLISVPLVLELQFPVLEVRPAVLHFGYVSDGDTCKGYCTLTHNSRTETLNLVSWCEGGGGGDEWRVSPRHLSLAPGATERVYVQYRGAWSGAPAEGRAVVGARGAGGAWCRAACTLRVTTTRHHTTQQHDHTDDNTLLPPPYNNIHKQ